MQFIVTAGLDGWVRCWDMQVMMDAEADADTSLDFYVDPIHEFRIASEYGISCAHSMLLNRMKDGTEYLVYDLRGQLMRISAEYLQAAERTHLNDMDIKPQCVTTFQTSVKCDYQAFNCIFTAQISRWTDIWVGMLSS